jgi:hypothetical protein
LKQKFHIPKKVENSARSKNGKKGELSTSNNKMKFGRTNREKKQVPLLCGAKAAATLSPLRTLPNGSNFLVFHRPIPLPQTKQVIKWPPKAIIDCPVPQKNPKPLHAKSQFRAKPFHVHPKNKQFGSLNCEQWVAGTDGDKEK